MPSKKKAGKKRSIGIPISPPEKECSDSKCAWHGSLPVRGRVFYARVTSAKSRNTVIVEWDYHRFIRKYERYQRQKSRVTAHNPPCMKAREGDRIVVAECRPIAKTKHFVVIGFDKDLLRKEAKK
jgi:small subunit ribosomal protein S17